MNKKPVFTYDGFGYFEDPETSHTSALLLGALVGVAVIGISIFIWHSLRKKKRRSSSIGKTYPR